MQFNIQDVIKGASVVLYLNQIKHVGKAVHSAGNQVVIQFNTVNKDGSPYLIVADHNGYCYAGVYVRMALLPVVRYMNLYSDNTPKLFSCEESAITAAKIKTKSGYPIVVAQRIESPF